MTRATELHRVILGDGPPILLMHGGLGFDHTYFRPWLDPLADTHTLIYYDHRGNGRSPEPADWSTVDHAMWADDAAALLDEVGHPRAVVLGHSYGGFLALELAERHPDRLDGLILADTAPTMDYAEVVVANAQARGTPEQVETVIEALTNGVRGDDHYREVMRVILPIYFEHPPEDVFDRVLGQTRFRATALNHANAHCLPEYDVRDGLPALEVTTLVMAGRHDWICPVAEGSERLVDGLPDAELVVFEDSGHFPFVEETDAFLDVTRRWLSDAVPET